jgi:GntR family transcriptional regulator
MKPKFITISDSIIEKIKSGELIPGDKIPSENELIKNYKISNTTARKTLLEIESKGWVRRIKGKGTFVLNRTATHQLVRTLGSIDSTRKGFNESLKAEGLTPKNIILEKTILNEGVSAAIVGTHVIIEGPVLKVHQLRYADDELMKDETRYISLTLCPKIDALSTEISYFKAYEQQYNLKINDIRQTLSADILEANSNKNHFGTTSNIAIFVLDSAVFADDGKVIEIEYSYYRGDKYKFAISAHPEYGHKSDD